MPERGEVPQAVIDKINAHLDNHQPPFSPEERKHWYDKAIEHYWEGMEEGMIQGMAEVELAAILADRVSKFMYAEIVTAQCRALLRNPEIEDKDFDEIIITLMTSSFMKGMHMRYLLVEKGVKHHEELYQLLIKKPDTN